MEFMTDIQENKIAKTDHPIYHLLAERWSPRMFANQDISRGELKILLEAARWAPSSNNEQPWRFIYAFRGSRGYEKIFSCLSDFNQKWVRNAPVLLLTAFRKKFGSGKDNFHALHDLGLAAASLTVQAQSMGIGVHQMAGVSWKKAHEVFDVTDEFHVATAIAIGYYGGDPSNLPEDLEKSEVKERKRMPQEDFAWEGRWQPQIEHGKS